MTKVFLIAAFLFAAGVESAIAIDLKDLMPCKVAALRFCDRSQGLTTDALYRCGTTLALRYVEVSRVASMFCADMDSCLRRPVRSAKTETA